MSKSQFWGSVKSGLKTAFPYILIFLQLYAIDIVVRLFTGIDFTYSIFWWLPNSITVIYVLFFIGVICVFKGIGKRIAYVVIFAIFMVVFLTQIIYYNMETIYFSFENAKMAGEGGGYIWSSIVVVFSTMPQYVAIFLCLIALGVAIFILLPGKGSRSHWKFSIFTTALFVVCVITGAIYMSANSASFSMSDAEAEEAQNNRTETFITGPLATLSQFADKNKCMRIVGFYHYTFADFAHSFLILKGEISDEDREFLEEQYGVTSCDYGEQHDSAADGSGSMQTNATPAANSHTGMYKGKNVIFLQLEGMDTWLINEHNTPTLYKMMQQGINFTQHYTMCVGAGSTVGSEIAVNNSLDNAISYSDNSNRLSGNTYPFAMAKIFGNLGYTSNVYHFNKPEFYNRNSLYNRWGYQAYHGLLQTGDYTDDISLAELDTEMFNNTKFRNQIFANKEKFANSIITYTPHAPFMSTDKRFINLIKKNNLTQYATALTGNTSEAELAYFYAKETDDMVKMLIQALVDEGLYDDTVLVVYADHYQYTLANSNAVKGKSGDNGELVNRTPFFIWSANTAHEEVSKVNMQHDILPTVFNMFGIDYDASKYDGHDIFGPEEGYAYFADYSVFDGSFYINGDSVKYVDTSTWANAICEYDATSDCYVAPGGHKISTQKVNALKNKVYTTVRKNDLTLRYDFLKNLE